MRAFLRFVTVILVAVANLIAPASAGALPPVPAEIPRPVLNLSPREIDLGSLARGQALKGRFTLKNLGVGSLTWTTKPLTGWVFLDQDRLSGTLNQETAVLGIQVSLIEGDSEKEVVSGKAPMRSVRLSLESGGRQITARRDLAVGVHREAIHLTSSGGERTVFVRFTLLHPDNAPSLFLEPDRLDFGQVVIGKEATRRVRLSNTGRSSLTWQVEAVRGGAETISGAKGRYLSFFNEVSHEGGVYHPPAHLREVMEISGGWSEEGGYPVSAPGLSSLKYRFSGTGASVHVWKSPGAGTLTVCVDNRIVETVEGLSEGAERFTIDGVRDLGEGPHELMLIVKNGMLKIEGLTLYGQRVRRGPPGWMDIFPNSGVTTRETDFVNVVLRTQILPPGLYRDEVLVRSNGGDMTIEVSADVVQDNTLRIIDVYRYMSDRDCLFTVNPVAEAKRLASGGYEKQGIAFRLFSDGTPGTTEFIRWFNPRIQDHVYTVGRTVPKSSEGYVLEGPIGNIATSRLNNTRPLYSWRHMRTGHHFYTTDQGGEGRSRRGFRFEGIVGYVR